MQSRFDGLTKYRVVAIHSDIPYEVGTHKATAYQGNSNRVQLINTWISKASGTQRAGRTGRIRPGDVYRLCSKDLNDKFQEHEQAEVHRQPLHNTILGLRAMLENTEVFTGMLPILNELLEPPDMSMVQDSFNFLYKANMITKPSDEGMLTYTGLFAGQLPVDLQLSRLIVHGISLGVGAEAVVLASALSQPKSVFRLASTLIHKDPDEYNEIMRQTFLGSDALDGGVLSQPILMLRLFLVWRRLSHEESGDLASAMGIAHTRMRQFANSTKYLLQKVNDSLHTTFKKFDFDKVDVHFSEEKLTLLRLVLTWTNEANVIKFKPNRKNKEPDYHTIDISAPTLTVSQIKSILPSPLSYKILNRGRRIFDATLSASRITSQNDMHVLLMDMFRASADHFEVALAWISVEAGGAAPGEGHINRYPGSEGSNFILFGLLDCSKEFAGARANSQAAIDHVTALNGERRSTGFGPGGVQYQGGGCG
eukprot:gene36754-45343_t